jgi:hypothetical protein
MPELDPLLLARMQFAFTVSFHIIFPTISIGLALFLAIVEGLWLKTGDLVYRQIYRFWLNIFAMGFGIGVVIVMLLSLGLRGVSFEFRHNSQTSRRRWDVVFAGGSASPDWRRASSSGA